MTNSQPVAESLLKEVVDRVRRAGGQLPDTTIECDLSADGGGLWTLRIAEQGCTVTLGAGGDADIRVATSVDDLAALLSGELSPMRAIISGWLRVQGDLSLVLRLADRLGR